MNLYSQPPFKAIVEKIMATPLLKKRPKGLLFYGDNMKDIFLRTKMLIGDDSLSKIKKANVIVFGCGGVGSYVIEGLVRAGITNISIVDNDIVSITNINRQLIALHSNVGKLKVEVVKERILDINPDVNVTIYPFFYNKDTYDKIHLDEFDFVIDAIDTISSKIYLAKYCYNNNINFISSMGTGNRLDPFKFKIMNLNQTSNDPVAKVMRYELRKENILNIKVLCSTELPLKPMFQSDDSNKRQAPASISFVPSVAGLLIASYVINELIKS